MRNTILLFCVIALVGCGADFDDCRTVKATKEECERYSGWGFSCNKEKNNSSREVCIEKYVNAVVNKKIHDAFEKEEVYIGKLPYKSCDYSYLGKTCEFIWKNFKESNILERVDGYIKIKYCPDYNCYGDEWRFTKQWFPKSEIIFYDDFDPLKALEEQKQKAIEKKEKEIRKLYESGKQEKVAN